ncbi:hypothetical protein TWF481_001732 [Arthrobotrys musiformis]|uniref:NACHT domain-containing protein n=1 Tax=Arthrobotrys musiformis TaxID=47236 RepID=A0AAV9VW42_9PEZI
MDPGSVIFNNDRHVKAAIQTGNLSIAPGGTLNITPSKDDAKLKKDDEINILRALYRPEAQKHKDRNPEPVRGTCEWFISHPTFHDWETNPSKILWVSADPGSGKSVLAKYLVDSVLRTTESRTTCYFFFKDSLDGRTTTTALCSIYQLFEQKRSLLSDNIIERFNIAGERFCDSFDKLWSTFLTVTKDECAGEVVCILDALDECKKEDRSELIAKLQQLYKGGTGSNLKFLITSRPNAEIGYGLHPLEFPASLIHLSGEGDAERDKISKEIEIFIDARVKRIGEKLNWTDSKTDGLLKALRAIPNRTYLWVHLTLELIESSPSTYINHMGVVSRLPGTVNEAYEGILSRGSRAGDTGLLHSGWPPGIEPTELLLKILVAAARPLRLREMILAMQLASSEDYHSYKELPFSEWTEQEIKDYIQNLCGFFVVVIDSTVFLIHQTAKEFLIENQGLEFQIVNSGSFRWKNSLRMSDCHEVLFNACVRYLYFPEFESGCHMPSSIAGRVRRRIFLDYSASHWTAHLRNAQVRLDDQKIKSIVEMCDPGSRRCYTWFQAYWATTNMDIPRNISILMVASYFGVQDVVSFVLEARSTHKIDINAVDSTYKRSALSWAAKNGFEDIVDELLKYRYRSWPLFLSGKAKVDSLDRYRRTPLTYAVWGGHTVVVDHLLRAGANPTMEDDVEGTPISYAICAGHNGIKEKLFGAIGITNGDFNPPLVLDPPRSMKQRNPTDFFSFRVDSKDFIVGKLLLSAVGEGHEELVELLLGTNKIDLEVRNQDGRTLLMEAMYRGKFKMVRLLLEKGADITATGSDGQTMLAYAVSSGNEDLVRFLLDNGSNIEAADREGKTPLFYAVSSGNEDLVRFLLDSGSNIEAADREGKTPLFYAVYANRYSPRDNEAVLRLLLGRGADIEATDINGFTPLSWLVINSDVDPSIHTYTKPSSRQMYTCQRLIREGASLRTRIARGKPFRLLYHAIYTKNVWLVEELLKWGASLEERDESGPTPLFYALRLSRGETFFIARPDRTTRIIQLLLAKGAKTEVTGANQKTLRLYTPSLLDPLQFEVQNERNGPWIVTPIEDIDMSDYLSSE